MRILGRPSSINVRKVLWTADELGLTYQHEPQWATPEAPSSAPAFRELNPNGLVPVIENDGLILWESNTICRYLATRYGPTSLLPQDPAVRASVEMWMDWQIAELNPAWRFPVMAYLRNSEAHRDPDAIAAGWRDWNGKMAILENQLARTGTYAAGAEFSLADVVLGLSTHRWRAIPLERPSMPAIEAWMTRLARRPAFARHASAQTP